MFAQGDSIEVDGALERGISLAEALQETKQLMQLLAGRNLFRIRAGDFAGAVAAAERYSAAVAEFGGSGEKVVGEWLLGGAIICLETRRRRSSITNAASSAWPLPD
jgi:hypothetical protein